ncbi:MAG: hypothetical protein DSM106950_33980 [Stigonema ocellatum SAG 48.90 = DSM 106950]|nr:hypothetical protein [Stigonema ocellatum SAG 48.90 = DSM 106950]
MVLIQDEGRSLDGQVGRSHCGENGFDEIWAIALPNSPKRCLRRATPTPSSYKKRTGFIICGNG